MIYDCIVWFIKSPRSVELIMTLLHFISYYYIKNKCVIDVFESICISKEIYADLQVWTLKERYKCPFSRAAIVVACARSWLAREERRREEHRSIFGHAFSFSLYNAGVLPR